MSRIMIIEDDRTMVGLLRTLLEMEGFAVVDSPNEEDIVAGIMAEHPDLIIMDVFLAEKDGLELLREVRAKEELNDICVIMSSGMDLSRESVEAGANAFVLKPYTPDQLIDVLRANLADNAAEK